METIFAVILAAATIAFVGYPLLKARDEEDVEPELEEASLEEELESQKEATYAAISELDFDHAIGNLSDKDHDELRERYKLKALALIKEIDELEREPEREPRPNWPTGHGAPVVVEDERLVRCSGCGRKVDSDDRFCPRCGKVLSSGCPSCGAAYDPEDAYCANCGGKL